MFEISKLKEKKLSELQEIAENLKISKFKTLKKLDLVYKILDHQASNPEEKDNVQEDKPNKPNPKFKTRKKPHRSEDGKENEEKNSSDEKIIDLRKNTILLKKMEIKENQRQSQTETETKETDTKSQILNLMRLSKVKVFLM